MPVVGIGIAVGAAAGGVAFGTLTAVGIGAAVGAIGAMAYEASRKTKLPSATYQSDKPQATASTIYPVQLVFGSVGMAGNFLRSTAPDQDTREIILGLGEGPMEGYGRFRYNDKDPDTLGKYYSETPDFYFSAGDGSDTPPPAGTFVLLAALGDLQTYRRTATLAFRLRDHTNTQVGQQPQVTVEGRQCWDLATQSVRSFSRNPAVIAATYLHDVKGVPWTEIDIAAFQALETYCGAYPAETDAWSEDLMGSGQISCSSVYKNSAGRGPSQMLYDNGLPWTNNRDLGFPCWVQYDFGAGCAQRVARYQIEAQADLDYRPHDWDLQGSNNGTDWAVLDTQTYPTWTDAVMDFDVPSGTINRYRYYRLYMRDGVDNDTIAIYRWKMFAKLGATAPRYTFDYVLDTFSAAEEFEKELGNSFHGRLIKSQGKWKPVYLHLDNDPGYIGESHIARDSFSAGEDERINCVRITYRDRTRDFRRETIECRDDEDIAVRGEVVFEETCDYITQRETALRRAQLQYDRRRFLTRWCKFKTGQWHSDLELYDVVRVDHTIQDGVHWYVEDIQADEWGRPTLTLREYSHYLFTDRLSLYQAPLLDPSGSSAGAASPDAPEIGTPAAGQSAPGGATITWEAEPWYTYLVETRLEDQTGAVAGEWNDAVSVQGNTYTYYLTEDDVATYGEDAVVYFRITSVTEYGTPGAESEEQAVTANPYGGAMQYAEISDGAGGVISLGKNFKKSSTRLYANEHYWIRRSTATESPDVWEYEEVADVDGNYNQVQPRSGLVIPEGAPVLVEYTPV